MYLHSLLPCCIKFVSFLTSRCSFSYVKNGYSLTGLYGNLKNDCGRVYFQKKKKTLTGNLKCPTTRVFLKPVHTVGILIKSKR